MNPTNPNFSGVGTDYLTKNNSVPVTPNIPQVITPVTQSPTPSVVNPNFSGVDQNYANMKISSENLTPVAGGDFQTPAVSYVPSSPILSAPASTPPMEMTPLQTEIQNLIKSTMTDVTDAANRDVYQTEQNVAQGIAEKTKLVNDLTSSFNDLARQAVEIKTQTEKEYGGRMITTAGLQGEINKRTSDNALAQARLASQIETARGNLTYAQQLADQAVKIKFGPIEAKRDAKIKNLELILQSPQYSIDQKNQAQKQLDYQNTQKRQEEKQKQDYSDVLTIAREAVMNSNNFKPTAQYPTLALAADAISKAKTPAQALAIQTATNLVKLQDQWSEPYLLGGDYVQKNTRTGEIRTAVNVPVGTKETPLSVLDVVRYNDLYPEAGIIAGDTEKTANEKVAKINTPEAKLRTKIIELQTAGKSYDELINYIKTSTTLTNKETAIQIANEVYGKSTTPTMTTIGMPTGTSTTTQPGVFAPIQEKGLFNFLFSKQNK